MSEARKGFVAKTFQNKSKPGANRPWFAWSFKIEDEQGNEDPFFYQFGFNKELPFKEGDYVSFEADPKDAKAMTFVEGSGKLHKNPPARKAKSQGGGGATVKNSDLFGEIGGYNTEDDIKRMTYSVARGHAVELVGILLENDALPSSVAKSKAGQADRFKEINAFVDKKTVEFYFDGSLRKLETVADAGIVNTDPDIELPDSAEAESQTKSDDVPPPDDDDDSATSF